MQYFGKRESPDVCHQDFLFFGIYNKFQPCCCINKFCQSKDLVVTICLVGYTCHTCSRTTENITQQEQEIGGEEFG